MDLWPAGGAARPSGRHLSLKADPTSPERASLRSRGVGQPGLSWLPASLASAVAAARLAARGTRMDRTTRVAQAAMTISVEEDMEEEAPAQKAQKLIKAKVARRVADVVIVITEPIGEEEPEPRPMAVVLHMAM
eukprot:g15852.t1